MDAAQKAVKDFMAKSGHHDTTVHEKVAPAVTHETINRQHHEIVATAIDKEIHQDHYHTSVQPVKDVEILPEQHHHKLGAVEHRQFEHGSDREVAERLRAEAAQFRDERVIGETRETSTVAPTIAGEHIHHHVHETIQPIINKETIEAHVTHTTIPIHEVHHNAAQHHSVSALPAVSMADFKKQGGVLTGREERYDGFEGEPRSVGGHSTAGTGLAHSGTGLSTSSGTGLGSHSGTGVGSHSTSGGLAGKAERGLEREEMKHGHGHHGTSGVGAAGVGSGVGSSGYSSSSSSSGGLTGRSDRDDLKHGSHSTHGTHGTSGTTGTTEKKPSLLDRLNPMKDTDHDGKKGFME